MRNRSLNLHLIVVFAIAIAGAGSLFAQTGNEKAEGETKLKTVSATEIFSYAKDIVSEITALHEEIRSLLSVHGYGNSLRPREKDVCPSCLQCFQDTVIWDQSAENCDLFPEEIPKAGTPYEMHPRKETERELKSIGVRLRKDRDYLKTEKPQPERVAAIRKAIARDHLGSPYLMIKEALRAGSSINTIYTEINEEEALREYLFQNIQDKLRLEFDYSECKFLKWVIGGGVSQRDSISMLLRVYADLVNCEIGATPKGKVLYDGEDALSAFFLGYGTRPFEKYLESIDTIGEGFLTLLTDHYWLPTMGRHCIEWREHELGNDRIALIGKVIVETDIEDWSLTRHLIKSLNRIWNGKAHGGKLERGLDLVRRKIEEIREFMPELSGDEDKVRAEKLLEYFLGRETILSERLEAARQNPDMVIFEFETKTIPTTPSGTNHFGMTIDTPWPYAEREAGCGVLHLSPFMGRFDTAHEFGHLFGYLHGAIEYAAQSEDGYVMYTIEYAPPDSLMFDGSIVTPVDRYFLYLLGSLAVAAEAENNDN